MPLVFNIQLDHKNRKIYIPLDLNYWFFESGSIPGELPPYLKSINEKLSKLTYDIREIIEKSLLICSNA